MSLGPLPKKRKFWLFLSPRRPRNIPLGGITSLCHFSLGDTTGWLKPNEQAGCSARSPAVLLAHAPAKPHQRGGRCVSTRGRRYCCLNAQTGTGLVRADCFVGRGKDSLHPCCKDTPVLSLVRGRRSGTTQLESMKSVCQGVDPVPARAK